MLVTFRFQYAKRTLGKVFVLLFRRPRIWESLDSNIRVSPLRVWCFSVPFRKEVFGFFRKRDSTG